MVFKLQHFRYIVIFIKDCIKIRKNCDVLMLLQKSCCKKSVTYFRNFSRDLKRIIVKSLIDKHFPVALFAVYSSNKPVLMSYMSDHIRLCFQGTFSRRTFKGHFQGTFSRDIFKGVNSYDLYGP